MNEPNYSVTPFAALGGTEMEKEAFLQSIGDGINNRLIKPTANAARKSVKGFGNVLGGAAKQVGNAVATPFTMLGGAVSGGMRGAQKGGLGGAVGGAIDGAWNAGARSVDRSVNNIKQVGTGLWNGVTGNLEATGRLLTAPAAAAVGAAEGAGKYMGGMGLSDSQLMGPNMGRRVNNVTPAPSQGIPDSLARPAAPAGPDLASQETPGSGQPGGMLTGADAPDPYAEQKANAPKATPVPGASSLPGGPYNAQQQQAHNAMLQQQGHSYPGLISGSTSSPGGVAGGQPTMPAGASQTQAVAQPDNAYLNNVMGSYNPNSPVDQRKAQAIQQIWNENGGRVSPNQIYANPLYKNASIDKEGAALGKSIGNLLMRGGNKMIGKGTGPLANLGVRISNAGVKTLNSPGIQKAVGYGAGATGVGLGGGALYGANRMGHSSGRAEGLGEGYDIGSMLAAEAAQQGMPQDPGILGRLMQVFRGTEQGPGADQIAGLMANNKEEILNQLRG